MEQHNTYTIHIGSAQVTIATSAPTSEYVTLRVDDKMSVSRAKVIKKVETDKFVAIISSDPERTFRLLAEQFVVVEAAGGVVEREDGELLMIRLRGRWDLPKGHVEMGEEAREAALREVCEETGIVADVVEDDPIGETWHAYDTYGRWELKCTRWWWMRRVGGELKPQGEEGITEVCWLGAEALDEAMKNTYETIKEVVAALHKKH